MVTRRLAEVRREAGIRGVAMRGLGVLGVRRLGVFSIPLDVYAPSRGGRAPAATVLGREGLAEAAELRPDLGLAELERRLDAGQLCLAVRQKGRLVALRWVDTRAAELPYLGLAFDLSPGLAYVHDAYTRPDARRGGYQAATYRLMRELLAEVGVESVLAAGLLENPSGSGLIDAAGYRRVGAVGSIGFGRARIPFRRLPGGYLGRARPFRSAD